MGNDRINLQVSKITDEFEPLGDNTTCYYDGKQYDHDKELFLSIHTESSNGSGRFFGDILLSNVRPFLEDLRSFNKTVSDNKPGYTFNLQSSGAEQYDELSEGTVIVDCPICENDVYVEDAFLSLPGFHDDHFTRETLMENESMEVIHKECIPHFIELVEECLKNSEYIDDAL